MLKDCEVARIKRGIYALPGHAMSENTGKIGKKIRSELSTLKNQEDAPRSPNLTDLTAPLQHSPETAPTSAPPAPVDEQDDGLDIPEFLRRKRPAATDREILQ
jgi:hypothetical protein